jgi:phage gp29-like protein
MATLSPVLRSEFATLEKSFLSFMGFFGGSGFILNNPDRTLLAKGGGQGLLLYDRVLEDTHAHAVFQQRSLELISHDWAVTPASDSRADRKAAELVERQLMALGSKPYALANTYGGNGFDGVALSLLEATAKGYAISEVMWAQDESEVFVAEVRPKDQRRFGWIMGLDGWELRLITDATGQRGVPLPDRKFIYHSPTATDANPYGLGLCSKVFWPVFFKRQNIQFWLIFADKFGSPTPVGKYAPGTSEADKATLLEALTSITQGMATAIPDGMLIEFLEATRSGSITTYEGLCRYMDEQISEAVLGQTGTTNQSDGGGSRARDEVARTGMMALIRADADLLARTLERTLIRWMVDANRALLGERAQPPSFKWVFDTPADLNELVKRDKVLFDMGFAPSVEYIVETYGEGFAPPEDTTSTPSPLNGAQVQSLTALLTQAVDTNWPAELLDAVLMATFPSLPEDTRKAIVAGVEAIEAPEPAPNPFQPVAPVVAQPEPTEDTPEDAAFAETDEPDTAALLAERLGTEAAPHFERMLATLRRRLQSAPSLAAFSEGLASAYPDLDDGALVSLLSNAISASRLAGLYEAQEDGKR